MATARVDDYLPNVNEDINRLKKRPSYYHPRQSYSASQGLVSSMLRMVGLDEHKIGMMVLNVLVYMAEYLAKNFLGMESELGNEIPEYRSIVENDGLFQGIVKMVENANAKSNRIKESLLNHELTEKVKCPC